MCLRYVADLHLVCDAQQIRLLRDIRGCLRAIDDLADRHELWEPKDIEACHRNLEQLSAHCEGRRGDACGRRREAQHLLKNLGCANVVLKILKLPYKHEVDSERQETTWAVFRAAFEFLRLYCAGSRTIQREMFEYVPFFLRRIDQNMGVATVISEPVVILQSTFSRLKTYAVVYAQP